MDAKSPVPPKDYRPVLATQGRCEALARLSEGLGTREPFQLVTGEAGTGKTTLVVDAVAGWGPRAAVAFLTNPEMTRTELLEEIARRFGAEPPTDTSKPQLLGCLERLLTDVAGRGQVAVVVVDDAHGLPSELLDELRLLANAEAQAGRSLEIVLVGLPALEARLAQPAFAPLRQRISAHCRLSPLSQEETRHYLHQLVNAEGGDGPGCFARATCREVFRQTRGVPRAIHTLAAEAMRRARAAGASAVTCEHVQAAAVGLGVGAAASESAPVTVGQRTTAEEAQEATLTASPGAGGIAHEAGPVVDPRSEDPRAREWVARFIGAKEPRFGSRFRLEALDTVDEVVVSRRSMSPPPDPETDAHGTVDPRGEQVVNVTGGPTNVSSEPPVATATGGRDEVGEPRFATRLDGSAQDASPGAHRGAPRVRRDSRLRRHPGSWMTPVAVLLFVLTALVAFIMLLRGRELVSLLDTRPVAATRTASERSSTLAPPPVTGSDTVPVAMLPNRASSHDSAAPAKKTPVPKPRVGVRESTESPEVTIPGASRSPRTRSPSTTPQPMAGAPVPAGDEDSATSHRTQRFALEVGTYVLLERAEDERDQLGVATGLQAWVVTGTRDGEPVYRVVLGIYRTPERAETSASLLIARGLVPRAFVIPLPPRSTRR